MAPTDLLAMAFVRRVLLELGVELDPEDDTASRTIFDPHGTLELWLRMSHPDLGGQTPVVAYGTDAGPAQLRALLRSRVPGPSRK